ncbi:MAG: ribosomal protein S19 family protein [archaeon]
MVKKEFTFRGKTMEELVAMSEAQFAVIAGSRIKRSLLRGNYSKGFLGAIGSAFLQKQQGHEPKIIRTHLRDFPVLPKMVGLKFAVYNGKEFQVMSVMDKMLGHYLGEFVLTRKRLSHGKAGIGATKSSTAITARG